MRRDARVLLTDIDRAGADIQLFTDGMDSTAYAADTRTQAAVERKFEMIGDAVNRLHADHPEIASKIWLMERIGLVPLLRRILAGPEYTPPFFAPQEHLMCIH